MTTLSLIAGLAPAPGGCATLAHSAHPTEPHVFAGEWFAERPGIVDNREFPGGVPEWLKGADCKSVGLAPTLVRIQPSPPRFPRIFVAAARKDSRAGVAQW